MKRTIIWCIRLYQKVFSPDQGFLRHIFQTQSRCVMLPSCSEYMILVIEKFGVIKGIYKGIKRILRCNPWQKNFIDPL